MLNIVATSPWTNDFCHTNLWFERWQMKRSDPPKQVERTPQPPMIGPFQPSHRPAPVRREVGVIEQGWINFQPYFKAPVAEHKKPKYGTVKAFDPSNPIQRLLDRAAEIDFLRDTQNLELETVNEELARTGLASSSLDQSRSDDEYGPTLADSIGPRDPVPYDAPSPALVRRIEWERATMACGQTTRFLIVQKPDAEPGKRTVIATRDKMTAPVVERLPIKDAPPEIVDAARDKLAEATKGKALADLIAAREAATFYGGTGSLLYGIAHGDHPTSALLNNNEEQRDRENRDTQPGPKELGLDVFAQPNEDPEEVLWPVTLREIAITLARRLPLSQIEGRWLARVEERKGEDFVRKALDWMIRRVRADLGLI